MKKIILTISIAVSALLLFSCKPEKLTRDFSIKDQVVEFVVTPAKKGNAVRMEEVLYEGDLIINIAQIVEQSSFSFDHIKSLILEKGSVELIALAGFDMNHFIGMKLYFENRNQLVAQADVFEADGVIRLSVINGDLLDKLKENHLHVIVAGVRPDRAVTLRLRTNYVVGVSLLK